MLLVTVAITVTVGAIKSLKCKLYSFDFEFIEFIGISSVYPLYSNCLVLWACEISRKIYCPQKSPNLDSFFYTVNLLYLQVFVQILG